MKFMPVHIVQKDVVALVAKNMPFCLRHCLKLGGLLLIAVSAVSRGQNSSPPRVSILWPESGVQVTAGLEIRIKAEATSEGGSIARVQFFGQTSELIGIVTNSPYNLLWTVGNGITNSYSLFLILTAVATDNLGVMSTSAPVRLFLYVGRPPSPIVGIIAPQNGAVFPPPASFLLSAEVFASIGDTGPEQFFIGTNSIGIANTNGLNEMLTANTPAVSVLVTNLPEGNYRLGTKYLGFNGGLCFCGFVDVLVSKLAIVSPQINSNGVTFGVVTAFAGTQNVIEVSTDLVSWIPISTNQPAGNVFTFSDPSPTFLKRFYRALVRSQ